MRRFHPRLETSTVVAPADEYPIRLEGLVVPAGEPGELFCTWTAGGWSEPYEGNMTFFSHSRDGGNSWDRERILFSHPSKGIRTSAIDYRGGTLRAYFNTFYNASRFTSDMQSYVSESRDGGYTFATPRALPGCINGVHVQQAVHDGNRLYLAVCWWEIRGGEEWAAPTVGQPPKPCIVAGRPSPHRVLPQSAATIDLAYAHADWDAENSVWYAGVLISEDDGASYRLRGRLTGNPVPRMPNEPTLCLRPDGTLFMLVRANGMKAQYFSVSSDRGETWSPLQWLDIPTPRSKARLYSDRAGNIYLLHNARPERRNPLSLWISHDCMRTWAEQYDLVDDDEGFVCYPDGFFDETAQALCFVWEDRKGVYYSRWRI